MFASIDGYTRSVIDSQNLHCHLNRFLQLGLIVLLGTSFTLATDHASMLMQSRQMLVVTTPDWQSVTGTLQRYERRREGEPWRKIGEPIAVVVGKAGMGWGHGIVAVPEHAGTDPIKQEGDKRSPAGVFRIGTTFGYDPNKPAAWAMSYRPLTPATECVDDRDSKYYNQIVQRTDVAPDWKSSEPMRSEGVYYEWGALVDQNPARRPGDGSCVFLHVSDSSGEGTTGCTAMASIELRTVLGWLKPGANPVLVEMPLESYKKAEKVLGLPLQ